MSKNKSFLKFYFIAFFCIYPIKNFAQKSTPEIDRIIKIIEENYITNNVDKDQLLDYTYDLYYLSKKANFPDGKAYSIFEQTRIYFFNGDLENSLKKINEGIALAKSRKDYDMLCRLLLVYQSTLLKLNYLNEAQYILKKCEEYNELNVAKENARINDVYILLAKADVLVDEQGRSDEMATVISLKKKAYSLAQQLSESDKYKGITIIYALESLTFSLAVSGDVFSARNYIVQIDKLLKVYPNKYSLIQSFIIKGAIESNEKKYAQAISYFSRAAEIAANNKNIYELYEIYPMMSASYSEMKDFKNASEYLWKFKHLSDSITQVMKKSENNKLIAEINKNIQKRDEKKLEQVKIDFALVFALFAMILSVFVLIVYKKKQKGSQTYNEFGNGNFLQNTEEKKKPEIDPEIIKELLLLVKNDIDTFYIEFPKIYPDFYQSLQKEYPSLTISDYSFCALVKMNFTVKEISLYTKLSLRSVEGRKYRIMKKMKVSNQNELYIVLSSIS